MPDHMHDPIVTVRREDLRTVLVPTAGLPNPGALNRLLEATDGVQCWEPAVVPADDARRLIALAQKRLTLDADDEMALGRLADCIPTPRAGDDR